MKRAKSFDNLLTDLHSEPIADMNLSALAVLESEDVTELSPLTIDEQQRLSACEQIIDEGLSTFMAVGNALIEIRHSKLYREKHRTFEAYCRSRFGIKRQRAYELMGAAEVVNNLQDPLLSENSDKNLTIPLPERESHANALSAVPKDDRLKVWQQVTETSQQTGKAITASLIQNVAQQTAQPDNGNTSQENTNIQDKKLQFSQKIRKSLAKAEPDDVRIEVQGGWLKRCGLEDAWRTLRGRPEWVINEKFKDWLTLDEAKEVGLIK